MKTEKTLKIVILTTIIVIIGCICAKFYLDYNHEKDVKKQEQLEEAYDTISIAFSMQRSKYYQDFSHVDINGLILGINAYKLYQPDAPVLTIDDVQEFLSEEYDENGEPRVLNPPDNIKKFIAWKFSSSGYKEFGHYANTIEKYGNDHEGYKNLDILETDIDTLNKIIEDFNNDPNREDYMNW